MSKIVAFSRSAGYLHQRAMKNRRESNMLDALDLMRGALEREPDNSDYEMDLAELYCEMGCYELSIRMLLKVLGSNDPVDECYFGMCCNFLALYELDAANSLIMRFLTLDPDAVGRSEVSSTLGELLHQRLTDQFSIAGRKKKKAHRLSARGQTLLKSDQKIESIYKLFESYSINPSDAENTAWLLQALLDRGKNRAARALLGDFIHNANEPLDVRMKCVRVLVYDALGKYDEAYDSLSTLQEEPLDDEEWWMVVRTAMRVRQDHVVYDLTTSAIKQRPYDVRILHARAASMINLGMKYSDIKAFYERILRIDPSDTVAQYFSKRQSFDRSVNYTSPLPDEESFVRIRWLMNVCISNSPEGLIDCWKRSSQLRHWIQWALTTKNVDAVKYSLRILSLVDDPEAELVMREYLLRLDAPESSKGFVVCHLEARGAKAPILVRGARGEVVEHQLDQAVWRGIRPSHRRVVFMIAQMGRNGDYGTSAQVADLWHRYLEAQGGFKTGKIIRPEAWVAALYAVHMKKIDDRDVVKVLARAFDCSDRTIRRYAKRIAQALDLKEENSGETN